jgi:hypothetical protein
VAEENPYAPPKAELGEPAPEEQSDPKPGVGARFLWTFLIGFPVYMFFVLFLPREAWLMGALGSAMFAVFSGIVAMCIPARSRAAFIIPSIMVGVIAAYMLGRSTS